MARPDRETPKVVMYATTFCPYCIRARRLLKRKGVSIDEISVSNDPALWEEMTARSGRNTVPQIFVGEVHVGGFDDLAALDETRRLDRLLGLER